MSFKKLTLILPYAEADAVADTLMMLAFVPGFTQYCTEGFSRDPLALSVAEQVAGRKRWMAMDLILAADDLAAVLQELQQAHGGMGLHYWVTPVEQSGRLN